MAGQVTLDTMLIAATQTRGGDVEAVLEAMVRDHARLVYRITYSILRNHHDAEDATQEVFLRVLRAKAQLAKVRDDKTWVATIAWRVAVDRRAVATTVSLDDDAYTALRDGLRVAASDAEQNAVHSQMRGWLERMLPALPDDLRDPLLLSTVEELNSAEIAEILKIPEATVRTRLMRARNVLKEKLFATLGKRP